MESLIRLLPDAIANQIAAGEVVQRPAAVVKELMENAIDAGATRIELILKDAGKTLIQVIDNGQGMSTQDARMCFERHATSKIRTQADLFAIMTLGFRGEAMASIAAVAQVRMRTKPEGTELGTEIEIEGNEIKKIEPVVTPKGTNIQVKNLFYNVPARRNFLKSPSVETRHVMNEFVRVALPHPEIAFSFTHNNTSVYDLSATTLKERIYQLIGHELKGELSLLDETTGYVRISGVIGSPKAARRNREEQFFFVNHRFIKNGLLNHAVTTAYSDLIAKDKYPFYCIFLEIDPIHIDINIHPTKTEVKFDDEQTLYALLHSIIKKNLGALHTIPQMDFTDNVNDALQKQIYIPLTPFSREEKVKQYQPPTPKDYFHTEKQPPVRQEDWNKFYQPISPTEHPNNSLLIPQEAASPVQFATLAGEYILAGIGEDIYIVHRKNAEERVLYERLLKSITLKEITIQQLLFPQTFEFSQADKNLLLEQEAQLLALGIEIKDFQGDTVILYGMPPDFPTAKVKDLLDQILADIKEIGKTHIATQLPEKFARGAAARIAAYKPFPPQEAKQLVMRLWECEKPLISPSGKSTVKHLSAAELSRFFG